jgi:hypothetical protein
MMLTTESNGYDELRLGFQRRDPHRPDAIFPVTSATEVEEAVHYAIEHDLRVAVQASGHSLTRGIDGGVLIATAGFNGVRVDADRKTAWIDAGATWRDVIEATAPYGLAPLSGSFPGVGAISYTLGGGLGLMARRYGYAADHVRRIELITPDAVRRNAEDDPDLFWALRGGGGNFGVVTGIEIDLFEVPTLYGGSLYLSERVADMWRNEPIKAVANGEPTYENTGRTGVATGWWQGHEAWSNLCAGGTMGVVYGAGSLWQWRLHPDEPGHSDYFVAPGAGWREAVAFEGSTYVGLLGKILQGLPTTDMRPDWTRVISGRAVSGADGMLIVYREHGGMVPVFDDTVPLGYTIVDPRDGSVVARGRREAPGDVIPDPGGAPRVYICLPDL